MGYKVHDFNEQYKLGEEKAKEVLDPYFSKWYDIKEITTRKEQRRGMDRTFRQGDRVLNVEYKVDFKTEKYGNAFIETISVLETGKLGWAWTCEADLIAYFTVPDKIYLVEPYVIRDHLDFWQKKFGVKVAKNKGYNSVGIPLPTNHFKRACKGVRDLL